MQSNRKWAKDHPVIVSVAFGLFVFAVGWCVMLAFWNAYGRPESRGFTYFVSFLFGDSIFLPVLAGALLSYTMLTYSEPSKRPPTLTQERCAWVVAIISALAGAFIQSGWLVSDQTVLNWTIPAPHEFNGAGWWHAGFFVFIFATIGYLSIRFIIARFTNSLDEKTTHPTGEKESILLPITNAASRRFAMYLVWFGAGGYAYLRQQEGLNIGFADWRLLVMIPGVTLVGWLLSSLLSGRRPTVDDVRLPLAGALSAYGIVVLSVGLLYGTVASWEIQIAISFALLATRLVPLCPVSKIDMHETVTTEIRVGLSAFGAILVCLKVPNVMQSPVTGISIAVLSILVLLFIAEGHRLLKEASLPRFQKHAKEVIYLNSPCLLLAIMLLGLALPSESVFFEGRELFQTAVLIFGIPIGMGLFNMHAKFTEEEKDEKYNEPFDKNAAYIRIMVMVIGILVLSILYVGQEAPDFSQAQTWALLLFLPVLGICIAMSVLLKRKPVEVVDVDPDSHIQRFRPKVTIFLALLALAYALLILCIYGVREPVYISFMDFLLPFPIVGSILFIVNGIIQNGRVLSGIDAKHDRALHIVISEIAVGCLVVFSLAILPSRQSDGVSFSTLSPLIGILGLYMAACILPRFAIQAVGCPTKGAGLAGVKQDTWNSFMMISVAGLLVIHVVEWQRLNNNFWFILGTLLVFAGGTAGLVRYTLRNNSKHYQTRFLNVFFSKLQEGGKVFSEKEKSGVLEDVRSWIDEGFPDSDNAMLDCWSSVTNELCPLRKHLEQQAHLVLIALLPYSLFFLLFERVFGQRENGKEAETPFVVDIYNHFLLGLPGLRKHVKNKDDGKFFESVLLPPSDTAPFV